MKRVLHVGLYSDKRRGEIIASDVYAEVSDWTLFKSWDFR